MLLDSFSDCSVECLGMLGRLVSVWQSVRGCLEGWSVVLDSFSDCSVECLVMLGRLVGGV